MTGKLIPLRRTEAKPADISDEALAAACATGDGAAMGALYDRYGAALRRFLGRMAGTDERDLDDLVQTTFEQIHKTIAAFENRSTLRTWIFGVTNNVARRHIRTEIRRKRLALLSVDNTAPTVVTPSVELEQRQQVERMRNAVLGLPLDLRETFVLVYMEGVAGNEAAAILGIGESAVWKRLRKARVRLQAELQGVVR